MIRSITKTSLGFALVAMLAAAALTQPRVEAQQNQQHINFKLPMHSLTVYTIEVAASVPINVSISEPPAADGSISGFLFNDGPIKVRTDPTTGRQLTTYTVQSSYMPQGGKSGVYTLSISPKDASRPIIDYDLTFKSRPTF